MEVQDVGQLDFIADLVLPTLHIGKVTWKAVEDQRGTTSYSILEHIALDESHEDLTGNQSACFSLWPTC